MSRLLRPRPLLLALAGALLLALALPLGATAQQADPERWSVTPADGDGPDGRSAIEHTLDPGETVEDRIAVRNVGEQPVTFDLAAADGFYTRTGRFDMLTPDQESVDAGTWITLPETVTVEAGETEIVDLSITVPERAEPGDHAAGVTASVLTVQEAEDGTSVGVTSRIGVRVLTRVTGEIEPEASIENVTTGYDLSWNVLRPGSASTSFEVVNDGNTRLFAEGSIEIGGQRIEFPAEGESRQELLPGDSRELDLAVDDVWPYFRVPVTITLVPEVATMDGSTSTLDPIVVETAVWAIPWPQLIVLLGIALIVFAVVRGRRRSRRKLTAMLDEAREEGRRSASAP